MVSLIKYGALSGGEKYNVNILEIDGLSTDTKPITTFIEYGVDGREIGRTNIENGSTFTEIDTGKLSMYDAENNTWYEIKTSGGGGGTGTDNYNLLTNKPKINNVEIKDNKSLVDLGILFGSSLVAEIDSNTYVVTLTLKDQEGNILGETQSLDLPLESVVVGGRYDNTTKKVVLTLQNGNTIEFSVADLVDGLQSELSSTNKLNPEFINYNSTHRAVSDTEKTTWNGKQDALTFDNTPTNGSSNPVKSGGVYAALDEKVDKVNGKGLSTNDFTNEDKAQITTNKNNISDIKDGISINSFGDVETALNGKVDKETGKGLSTNDYTDADRATLVELVDGGAKNKMKYKSNLVAGYTETKGEVTFIVNDDLSITATSNGANVAARRTLSLYDGVALHSNGDIISGGLSSQCIVKCELNEAPYTDYGTDKGTGTHMTTASGEVVVFVRVEAGTAVDVTFKPMICTKAAWDISQTYQPYRPSYQALYEMILALQSGS